MQTRVAIIASLQRVHQERARALHAGALLHRLHDSRDVGVRPEFVAGELEEPSDRLDHSRRHAERFALGEKEFHVLEHQPGGEAEIERAGQNGFGEFVFGRRVAPGAGVDDIEHDRADRARPSRP